MLTLLAAHSSTILKFGAGAARIHLRSSLVCRTDTAGPTLRGAARSRTLQKKPSLLWVDREPKTNYGSHTARSGQESGSRHAHVGRPIPWDASCDTMRGARGLLSGSCVW